MTLNELIAQFDPAAHGELPLTLCVNGEDYFAAVSVDVEQRTDDKGVTTDTLVITGEDDDEGEADHPDDNAQDEDAATETATAENGTESPDSQ